MFERSFSQGLNAGTPRQESITRFRDARAVFHYYTTKPTSDSIRAFYVSYGIRITLNRLNTLHADILADTLEISKVHAPSNNLETRLEWTRHTKRKTLGSPSKSVLLHLCSV
ncbi:hypothetical protein ElyMa_005276000 [Elysia marginata]|uniref:Uncharacterized protein n=1 Tax=Elysia marginata TaxID=1093978 RepID=A0AAV4JYZ6_9GAST|nr:hypothetical protein ElyMa_005276000 [Elysia marginata]